MNNLRSISLIPEKVDSWDNYPFNIGVIKTLNTLTIRSKVCFFVGENGSGKSTLIEGIADNFGFSKEGGTKNTTSQLQARKAYSSSKLSKCLRLSWVKKPFGGFFLRAESFFNFATYKVYRKVI